MAAIAASPAEQIGIKEKGHGLATLVHSPAVAAALLSGAFAIVVADSAGHTVRRLTGPATPGFHRVVWNLQRDPHEQIAHAQWSGAPQFVAA